MSTRASWSGIGSGRGARGDCEYPVAAPRSSTAVVKEAARALRTGLRILAPLLKVPYEHGYGLGASADAGHIAGA
jgi:hypothetical protein